MRVTSDPTTFDTIDDHGADYYVRFLDARTSIDDEHRVKQVITDMLRLADGLAVLDVGAGTGADTCALAAAVAPTGCVIGLDHSQRMVAEARRRAARELSVDFVEGDALALPFEDQSFDRCRAERVLSHLTDPARAIRELARVTRPGGRVVVSDLDTETLFLNSSNTKLARSLALALTDDLPSPRVGRWLPRLFAAAGLVDVWCVPTVVRSPVSFLRMVLGGRLDAMADRAAVTEFWAELERGEREGWLCSGVVCFTVAGHTPV